MKTIYLLLTCSTTLFSRSIRLLTASPYTHVAISLTDDLTDGFVSFGRKIPYLPYPAGLVQEVADMGYLHAFPHTRCTLLSLDITEEAYRLLETRLRQMLSAKKYYRYNLLGALLCGIGIPYVRRRRYFCSQFVGELLEKSGAALLPKTSSLMQPIDYAFVPGVQVLYTGEAGELYQLCGMTTDEKAEISCIPA